MMARRGMDWTAAMIDSLTAYWNSGMVAAEIAAMMAREFRTPFTKNGVVGKAHRLRLAARPSPIRAKKSRPVPAAQQASASAPRVPKMARPRVTESSLNSPRPPKLSPAKVEPLDGLGILSAEMTGRHCQWPLWGDDLPPLGERRHCGCAVATGRPYCEGHAAIAYVKIKPRAEGVVLPSGDWARALKLPPAPMVAAE